MNEGNAPMKSEGSSPSVAGGNRWWYLLESAKAFRHLSSCSLPLREESAAMAEHLDLMWKDAEYRAAVLGHVEEHLAGVPKQDTRSAEKRQARHFLELCRTAFASGRDDLRQKVAGLIDGLVHFDPLALGDVGAPKLTNKLLDDVAREVTTALDRTKEWRTNKENGTTVARTILRAVGVPKKRANDLYR